VVPHSKALDCALFVPCKLALTLSGFRLARSVICFSVIFRKLLNQCSNQGGILRDGVAYREQQMEEDA
jgi:hypothetical protein